MDASEKHVNLDIYKKTIYKDNPSFFLSYNIKSILYRNNFIRNN